MVVSGSGSFHHGHIYASNPLSAGISWKVMSITDVAKFFLNDMIKGYNIYENDGIEPLIDIIKTRFHGSSQKCIAAILRDVHKKFCKWKIDNNIE